MVDLLDQANDAELSAALTGARDALEDFSRTAGRSDSSRNQESARPASPVTISVWGPGGSPGRSTVAINLADSFARMGYSALLVDADLFNPSLALMLGTPLSGHTLSTLFAELNRQSLKELSDYVAETGVRRLSLLPGISNQARASEIRVELFAPFLAATTAYDFVVFDVAGELRGSGSKVDLERVTRFLVRESHLVIAVGDSSILGIDRLSRQASDLRKLRLDRPFRIVLNRVDPRRDSSAQATEIFERLTKERVASTLPFDRKTLSAALELGCPASVIRQRGEFSKAMLAFATSLVTP